MRLSIWLPSCLLVAALTSVGCTGAKLGYNLPPSSRLMEPGPGVGGPGPGVIPVPQQMSMSPAAMMPATMQPMPADYARANMGRPGGNPNMVGPMQASYIEGGDYYGGECYDGSCEMGGGYSGCLPGGDCGGMGMPGTSQISFLGEEPLQIGWDVNGSGCFDSTPLSVPGKQDFPQAAIYRLRLSQLPGRETVMLYPTLEVAPVTPRTEAYLAHAPIPVQFTEEDFDQVLSGNFLTKVIYLPDPEFTEIALAGVETLVSTRLDPGVDPIAEADRRGSILAILRMGNKDLGSNGMGGGGGCIVPADYQAMGEPTLVHPENLPIEGEYVDGGYPTEYGEGYVEGEYADGGYVEGEYADGGYVEGEYADGSYVGGEYADGGYGYGNGGYAYGGGAGMSNMPMGTPTGGMQPAGMPPHTVANMAPYWGMPMSGTPIGLPGPPHIPLGVPAGLQKHVMKNRTRVCLPPPTDRVKISVKQRPGMNYPRPVSHVSIDEVNRAPVGVFHGTVPGIIPEMLHHPISQMKAAANSVDCNPGYQQ